MVSSGGAPRSCGPRSTRPSPAAAGRGRPEPEAPAQPAGTPAPGRPHLPLDAAHLRPGRGALRAGARGGAGLALAPPRPALDGGPLRVEYAAGWLLRRLVGRCPWDYHSARWPRTRSHPARLRPDLDGLWFHPRARARRPSARSSRRCAPRWPDERGRARIDPAHVVAPLPGLRLDVRRSALPREA